MTANGFETAIPAVEQPQTKVLGRIDPDRVGSPLQSARNGVEGAF